MFLKCCQKSAGVEQENVFCLYEFVDMTISYQPKPLRSGTTGYLSCRHWQSLKYLIW